MTIYITSQYNYLGFTFMPSGKKRVGIENLMVCKVKWNKLRKLWHSQHNKCNTVVRAAMVILKTVIYWKYSGKNKFLKIFSETWKILHSKFINSHKFYGQVWTANLLHTRAVTEPTEPQITSKLKFISLMIFL